jgi:hypothetical protein
MGKRSLLEAETVTIDGVGATILPFTDPDGTGQGSGTFVVPQGDGRYERGQTLGKGGMGTVFEATDLQFGRTVALKEADAKGAAAMARFSVEALVTANLEHPGITPVYERGVGPNGKPFYTMCRIKGRTLTDAIAEAKTVEARLKLLPVVIRVAQTLAYAHERGVVHRDIKPDNVIVGRHGETFVLDWGIAKVRGLTSKSEDGALDPKLVHGEAAGADSATRVGSLLGTPAYMAPEQAAGRIDEIDERTDVFALGALLYHVTAGRPPYAGPTLLSLVEQAMEANPPPVSTLVPGVPPALHRVIERAMAASRDDRFQTAADLASALENTLTDALTGKTSPFVRAAIGALTLAGVIAVGASALFASSVVSTFRDQGAGAFMALALFIAGLGLIVIDWRSRGRHGLSTLTLVFAALTFLVGIAAAASNLEIVLHVLKRPDAVADLDLWRNTLTEGAWEALGSVPTATSFACIQLTLWAAVQRQNRQHTQR